MQWPATELEWWAACFSIDDNNDKPMLTKQTTNVKESIEKLKEVLN